MQYDGDFGEARAAAVGLDDLAAPGGGDAGHQRMAVAALGDVHHSCASGGGDLHAAVGRAVVGDDDLAVDAERLECAVDFVDANAERVGFVEAGKHDGKLRRVGGAFPSDIHVSHAASGHTS